MVSRDNFQQKSQQAGLPVPTYGLRKLSIGFVSVLLGTSLYMGVSHPVKAATTDQPTTTLTVAAPNHSDTASTPAATPTSTTGNSAAASDDKTTDKQTVPATALKQSAQQQAQPAGPAAPAQRPKEDSQIAANITLRVVDDTDPRNSDFTDPLYNGVVGDTVPASVKDELDTLIQTRFINKGYVLENGYTLPDKLTAAHNDIVLHVVHGAMEITADTDPKDIPAKSAVTHATVTKLIHVRFQYYYEQGPAGHEQYTEFTNQLPDQNLISQDIILKGTAYIDKVDGHQVAVKYDDHGNLVVDNTKRGVTQWEDGHTQPVNLPKVPGYSPKRSANPLQDAVAIQQPGKPITITVGNSDSGLQTGPDIVVDPYTSTIVRRYVVFVPLPQQIDYQIVDRTTGQVLVAPSDSDPLFTGQYHQPLDTDHYNAAIAKLIQVTNELAKEGYAASNYIEQLTGIEFNRADNHYQPITIYVSHGVVKVDPQHPGQPGSKINADDPRTNAPTYPAGSDQLTRTVTRTIRFEGAGNQTPAPQTQHTTFLATGYLDKVTGKWIKSATDFANVAGPTWTGNGRLAAVTVPAVDGYYVAGIDRDAAGNSIKAVTVDRHTADYTVTVRYAKEASAQVIYVDGGQTIAASPTITGIPGQRINYSTATTLHQLEQLGYRLLNNGFDPDGTAPLFDTDPTTTHVYLVELTRGSGDNNHKPPVTPGDTPSTPGTAHGNQPTNDHGGEQTTTGHQPTASQSSSATNQQKHTQLPQTGNQDSAALLSVGFVTLASLLGFGLRKRQN